MKAQETAITRWSLPRLLLHLEGFAVLVLAVVLYRQFAATGWLFFALVLFTPDLAMLPYMINKRAGIIIYNIVHTYTVPLFVGLFGLATRADIAFALALVWAAHIGMDRTIGYGLKYADRFKETHLNRA